MYVCMYVCMYIYMYIYIYIHIYIIYIYIYIYIHIYVYNLPTYLHARIHPFTGAGAAAAAPLPFGLLRSGRFFSTLLLLPAHVLELLPIVVACPLPPHSPFFAQVLKG